MNINPNISSLQNSFNNVFENNKLQQNVNPEISKIPGAENQKSQFSDTVNTIEDLLNQADNLQQSSDVSIKDLLSGKNSDITSVVSEVAKADVSFKLLVGVRNKLIEAYKQTMNMPI